MTALVLTLCLCQLPGEPPLDAPPLSDLGRFPGYVTARDTREFIDRVIDGLEGQQSMRPHLAAEYRAIIAAFAPVRPAWDALEDARWEGAPKDVRRLALARLKDALGERDYAAGRMPALPWEMLPEIE